MSSALALSGFACKPEELSSAHVFTLHAILLNGDSGILEVRPSPLSSLETGGGGLRDLGRFFFDFAETGHKQKLPFGSFRLGKLLLATAPH